MLKTLSGFISGVLSTLVIVIIFLKIADYANSRYDIGSLPSEAYEFNGASAFMGDKLYADNPNTPAFKIVQHTPLFYATPADVKLICLRTQPLYGDDHSHQLTANIFLEKAAQANLAKAIGRGQLTHLSLNFEDKVITQFRPDEGSATNYIKTWEYNVAEGDNPLNRYDDFEFNALPGNEEALLQVIHDLSPSRIPQSCNDSFNPDKVSNWKTLIQKYWGNRAS